MRLLSSLLATSALLLNMGCASLSTDKTKGNGPLERMAAISTPRNILPLREPLPEVHTQDNSPPVISVEGPGRLASDVFGIVSPAPKPNFGEAFPSDPREIPGVSLIIKYPVENPDLYLIHFRQAHMFSGMDVLLAGERLRGIAEGLENGLKDKTGVIPQKYMEAYDAIINLERENVAKHFINIGGMIIGCQNSIYTAVKHIDENYGIDTAHVEGLTYEDWSSEGWNSKKEHALRKDTAIDALTKLSRVSCIDVKIEWPDLRLFTGGLISFCDDTLRKVYPGEFEKEYLKILDELYATGKFTKSSMDKREDATLKAVIMSNKGPGGVAGLAYGGSHDFADNVCEWNRDKSNDRKVYLIDLFPGDKALYFDEQTNKIREYVENN